MRNIFFTILLLPSFSAFSQTTSNYDYLQAYRRFTLAGRSVKGISNDTAMLFGSPDSLVTQYALKGYLAGHGIGIKGRQHQLLGAKADSTTDLQYLEPLVEGAFVVSDSELNATTLMPAIYDLRNGEKWVSDNAGNFTKDTSGNTYFTDYGVRRFLYNPTTQKTFYVKPDSSYSQIGSGNVFNVHADTTINNTYVSNDNSYYYNLGDSSYLDDRDFYNDGAITNPYRVRRYDNAYIDSLFASITPGGGGGTTVNNFYTSKLPYNGDSTYYLGGDTIPHKLPAYAGLDTTSLSRRIDTKLNITDTAGKWLPIGTKFPSTLKLTTNGQSGPSQLDTVTNTLNVPNYFFANSPGDSIDYSFVSMTTIYNEKGPGEYLTGGHGVTVNPDNTLFPFRQVKALDVSGWNSNDYVSFNNSTNANATAYTFLRCFIRLKQVVPTEQSLSFAFYLNGALVSKVLSAVNYGLNKNRTDIYSNITIPMSAFGFTSNSFDEIRLIFGGGSSANGLYLDLFQFQNATEKENAYITDLHRIPGTTTVEKVIGGLNVFAYNDSVGAAIDTQYLRRDINLKLNITDTANKWIPRTTPIVTAFNGRAGNVLPQLSDYSAYYLNSTFGTPGAVLFRGATGISQDPGRFSYDSANATLSLTAATNNARGMTVQNTSAGTSALASISAANNTGEGISLQIGSTSNSFAPLRNTGGVTSSVGMVLITDDKAGVSATNDFSFYHGAGATIPSVVFKPNKHALFGGATDNANANLITQTYGSSYVRDTLFANTVMINGVPAGSGGNTAPFNVNGVIRSTGSTAPTSGAGVEMMFLGSGATAYGQFLTYDRSNAAYRGFAFDAQYEKLYNSGVEAARIENGKLSIGTQATPSALLHLKASSGAAGTAPVKLSTSGATLMTTPEAGAFETDGTDLYWTNSAGVRKKVTLQ